MKSLQNEYDDQIKMFDRCTGTVVEILAINFKINLCRGAPDDVDACEVKNHHLQTAGGALPQKPVLHSLIFS